MSACNDNPSLANRCLPTDTTAHFGNRLLPSQIARPAVDSLLDFASQSRQLGFPVHPLAHQIAQAVARGGIAAFADLAKPGLKLVICAAPVPCGAATLKLQTATGVTLTPVSEEQSVTDVLAKVEAGEADAGLVYSTDVIAAGEKVRGIAFPEAARAINSNSIVALKASSQAAPGQQFVDLVLSADGQKVLAEAGFGAAP